MGNKHFARVNVVIIAVMISCSSAFAYQRTSGADFLKIPLGAQYVGLSEAMTACPLTSDGIRVNAAGLGPIRNFDGRFSYTRWLFDTTLYSLSAVYPLKVGTIGISAIMLSESEVPLTDSWGDTYSSISTSQSVIKIGYGLTVINKPLFTLSVGAAGQYVYKKIASVQGGGAVFDFGITARTKLEKITSVFQRGLATGEDTDYGSLTNTISGGKYKPDIMFGFTLKNYGTKIVDASMPQMITFGIASHILENLLVSIDFKKTLTSSFYVALGGEYTLWNMFDVRLGARLVNTSDYITAGVGFHRAIGKGLVSIDYAFDPHSGTGLAHHITVGYSYSPHVFTPEEFYYKGINVFIQGNYVLAERYWKRCLQIDKNYQPAIDRLAELERARNAQRMLDNLDNFRQSNPGAFSE